MRSIHTHQLGPWNINQQVPFGSRQYHKMNFNKQISSPRKLILPKLAKIISSGKQIQIKPKQVKQKNQQQIKMSSIQIQLQNQLRVQSNLTEISGARKSRTLSFNPPMISFYNKKHPKIKKIKQKNAHKMSNFYSQKERQQSEQSKLTKTISKINLMDANQTEKKILKVHEKQQQRHQALTNRSSFKKLINLLRISDNNQSWTERARSYFNKQKFNGISRYLMRSNNYLSNGSIEQQKFFPYRQTQKISYLKRQKSVQSNLNKSK